MKKLEPVIFKTERGEFRVHQLKTWTKYFQAVNEDDETLRKTVEVRLFDRNYKVGDFLLLKEYNPSTNSYTGLEAWRLITHILDEKPFVPDGYVIMSIMEKVPEVIF
jgi:hypothetical protein